MKRQYSSTFFAAVLSIVIVASLVFATTVIENSGILTSQIDSTTYLWNGLNRTDAVAYPIATASYIIDVVGSDYRMKNGTTGQFDFVSTNASAVINNALGNLTAGGSVFVKAGTYTISTYISANSASNVTLCGEGRKTILQLASSYSYTVMFLSSVSGWTIRDMAIDGNKAGNVPDVAIQGGLYMDSVSGCEATNLYVTNCMDGGIGIRSSNDTKILGCETSGNVEDGITTELSNALTISTNTCHDSITGILVHSTNNSVVSDNICHDNSAMGIQIYGKTPFTSSTMFTSVTNNVCFNNLCGIQVNNGADYNTFTANTVYNNSHSGFDISSDVAGETNNNLVSSNIMCNNGWHGIALYQVYHTQIIGNSIYNNTLSGVVVGHDSLGASLKSNSIIGNKNQGISLGLSSNCSITNNEIAENTYNGILIDDGSHNTWIEGNFIHDNDFGSTTTYDGIVIVWGSDKSTIVNNKIFDNDNYEIAINSATCDDTLIRGNIFSISNDHVGYISNSGTGTIIKFNVGFVTENSVSGANTTATTAVINHGLASTATYVWCSFNDTSILSYTWTSSATQITVTVTGTLPASWTVYAKVEYVP